MASPAERTGSSVRDPGAQAAIAERVDLRRAVWLLRAPWPEDDDLGLPWSFGRNLGTACRLHREDIR
ncbi:MAG: hypothetical protein WBM96_17895, partial [Polyangiales bacterium]